MHYSPPLLSLKEGGYGPLGLIFKTFWECTDWGGWGQRHWGTGLLTAIWINFVCRIVGRGQVVWPRPIKEYLKYFHAFE